MNFYESRANMKLIRFLPLGLVLVNYAFAQDSITAGTPTLDTIGKTFFVFVPITNGATSSLTSVSVTRATLNTVITATGPKLPFSIGTLAASSNGGIALLFPDQTLVKGQSYPLALAGTFQENGTAQNFQVNITVTFGVYSIFDLPANPLAVTPALDSAHAVTQLIAAKTGGTLTATGSDGSVFSLTIPVNALASEEQITMTPLLSVGAIPVSGGLLAGVDLQPDGLALLQAATLTIQPALSVTCSQQVGFGYHGTGQEFYFQPLGLTQTITITLEHFGGAGVGQGQAGHGGVPTSMEDRLSAVDEPIFQSERQCSGAPVAMQSMQSTWGSLAGEAQLYFDKEVVQQLKAAETDASQAESALAAALAFWHDVSIFGLDADEPFATDIQFIQHALPVVLTNYYNTAYQACLNASSQTARMEQGNIMIAAERFSQLLGYTEFPQFTQQLAACVTGPLTVTIDSIATGVDDAGGETINTQSSVSAASLPLTFNSTTTAYTGEGTLSYNSFDISVQWPKNPDCSTGHGNPGQIAVLASFDLNLFPASPDQVRLQLTLGPTIGETISLGLVEPTVGCNAKGSESSRFYVQDLLAAHPASNGVSTFTYYVNVNTPATFIGQGVDLTIDPLYAGTENTTITASQTQ
jgi:hypothetical protein